MNKIEEEPYSYGKVRCTKQFYKGKKSNKYHYNYSISIPTKVAKYLDLKNKDKLKMNFFLEPSRIDIYFSKILSKEVIFSGEEYDKIEERAYEIFEGNKKMKSSEYILLLREKDHLLDDLQKMEKRKKKAIKDKYDSTSLMNFDRYIERRKRLILEVNHKIKQLTSS